MQVDAAEFENLKHEFLRQMPDFRSFADAGAVYVEAERRSKDELVALVRVALLPRLIAPAATPAQAREVCAALYQAMQREALPSSGRPQNLVGWRSWEHLTKLTDEQCLLAASALRDLLLGEGDAAERLERFANAYQAVLPTGGGRPAVLRNVGTLLLMLVDPGRDIFVRTDLFDKAGARLSGRKLGGWGRLPSAADYRDARAFAAAIRQKLAEEGWAPRDMIDVQSFLWVAMAGDDAPAALDAGPPVPAGGGLVAILAATDAASRRLVVRIRPPAEGIGGWLAGSDLRLDVAPAVDLAASATQKDLAAALADANPDEGFAQEIAAGLWLVRALQPGDVVVAGEPSGEVLAAGVVTEPYQRLPAPEVGHRVGIAWHTGGFPRRVEQRSWSFKDIHEVPRELLVQLAMEQSRSETLPELPFAEIVDRVRASGLRLSERTLRRYHVALKARGFVILAGVSGTGKTWLTDVYAKAVGARYLVVPVAPNWTTNEDLLGYFNPLDRAFHATAFTRFLQEAGQEYAAAQAARRPARPFHLVLDEMNLARVEYYFATFLSAMELRARNGQAEVELAGGRRVALPPNLAFIGTVNVDETTHAFADKIYDRAQMLELDSPRELLAAQLDGKPFAAAVLDVWDVVAEVAPFAFRVLSEIDQYVAHSQALGVAWQDALDEQVLQKVLPKIKGNDARVGDALQRLVDLCAPTMPLSATRARQMHHRFLAHGFTSFF